MPDRFTSREPVAPLTDGSTDFPGLGPTRLRARRRRKPNYPLRRMMALAILLGLVGGVGTGIWNVVRNASKGPVIAPACDPADRVNVLVIGIDPKPFPVSGAPQESRRLADTLMLFSLDAKAARGYVLSIPRETKATLGNAGEGVLGDALAVGGLTLVRDTIEQLTGLTIRHHVALDLDASKRILKELGPCELHFNRPIKVDEESLGLKLNREAGWQLLQPDETLAFAFQRTEDEIDRLERQQMLVRMWQAKLHGTWNSLWLNRAFERAHDVLETDLNRRDFETIAVQWRQMAGRDLTFALLPGDANARGEWLLAPKRWDALLPRLQKAPSATAVPVLKPTVELLYDEGPEEKVILLAATLQEAGFQVIRHARAYQVSDETLIVDRLRSDERSVLVLEALLEAIGPARIEVTSDTMSPYGAQLTVRLGRRFFR